MNFIHRQTFRPRWVYTFLLLSMVCAFVSCAPEKYLHEDEYLLVKNKVNVDKKNIEVSNDLVYAVRPKTNKRTFGLFLWRVGVYQYLSGQELKAQERRPWVQKTRTSVGKYPVLLDTSVIDYHRTKISLLRKKIQNDFGEEPVLLDTNMIAYSIAQVKLMMFNNGYFNAEVSNRIKYKGKRAIAIYDVEAGEPYRIQKIEYDIADSVIRRKVFADTIHRLVKVGDIFSVDKLTEEQERIANRMQNRGYFYFTKNYIHFLVDSNHNNQCLDVKMVINNPTYQVDDSTFVEGKHRIFRINSVSVMSNFATLDDNELQPTDTLYYVEVIKRRDTNEYAIYNTGKRQFKPKALVYPISMRKGRLYSAARSQSTYDRYADMQNFEFIKVSYAETQESMLQYDSDTGDLDCRIQLSPLKKHNMVIDLMLKNTGSRIGFGGSIALINRNLFKGAEIFSFAVKYTHELQHDSMGTRFRNFEVGGTLGLEVPRFLFPIKQQNISKSFRPRTSIQLTANYMRQDLYDRFLSNVSFAYKWSQRLRSNMRVRIEHVVTVLDFSLIKMYNAEGFDEAIAKFHFKRRILEKYKDHFILGSNYHFTMYDANKFVFKLNVEWFGNVLYGIMKAAGNKAEQTKNDYGQYTIWKIPFANGLDADADIVYNIVKTKTQHLVMHADIGVGAPIWNSTSLPFEHSFYLGGSNSMRGWRLRTLGPGGYCDTSASIGSIESVGDIKLELNLEYRFKIYKIFHGALFVDAGNIWLLHKHVDFPNGEFAFNRFYKEIAMDAGIGLRLDLSFIVIRLDYALKIHNPAIEGNQGWQHFKWDNYQAYKQDRSIVFGIGYPF